MESASHSSGDELATAATVATVATLYRALFELLPSSVVLVDPDGRVRDVNPAFCRQIGFTREELIGQPVTRFSADPPQVVTRNLARLRGGEVLEHEVVNRHKDGSLRYYELRERMVDLPDATRAILAVASDITERKRAELERLELERARARSGKLESLSILAGGVAHDFNSLLTVVLARLELALAHAHAREDALLRGSLEESALAARRAADLARQMLAYSGRGRFVARPLQLAKLVAEVVDALSLPESSDASVHVDLGDGLPEIEGDAAQVVQVASELLANAVEALPLSGGVIRVNVRCVECSREELAQSRTDSTIPAGRFVAVELADNGHGMTDEVRERMFEPFFSTRRAGRGLGLAAVLGIVRGHKGALFVDSAPGHGTRVRVLFPVASRPAVTVLTPARPLWRTRGVLAGTVLIAEDEDGIRRLMEALLRDMGLGVLAAPTGEGAVELLREHTRTVTFALLDLSLPGISGAETLARLRQLRPDLSAILTSGYERESIRGCQAEAGFIDFLQKPFDIATFRETIESAHARVAGVAR